MHTQETLDLCPQCQVNMISASELVCGTCMGDLLDGLKEVEAKEEYDSKFYTGVYGVVYCKKCHQSESIISGVCKSNKCNPRSLGRRGVSHWYR